MNEFKITKIERTSEFDDNGIAVYTVTAETVNYPFTDLLN